MRQHRSLGQQPMTGVDIEVAASLGEQLGDPGHLGTVFGDMGLHVDAGMIGQQSTGHRQLRRAAGHRKARRHRISQPTDAMPASYQRAAIGLGLDHVVAQRLRRMPVHQHLAGDQAHASALRGLEQRHGTGQVDGRKDHRRGAAMGQQGVEEQRRRGLRESRVGVPGLGRKGVALKPVQQLGAPGGDHVELRAVDMGVDETRHQQLAAAVELEPVVARRLGLHRSDPASGVDQQPMRRTPAHRRAERIGQAGISLEVEQVGQDRRRHRRCSRRPRQRRHASPPASSRATSRTCSRNQRTAGEAWVRSCQSW